MTKLRDLMAGAALLAACAVPAWAQSAAPTTTAGPGRIICKSAAACDLGLGVPAKMHYQIDPSALPEADRARLKTCTAKGKPCVATVVGTEGSDPLKVKAGKITFYD